MDKPTVSLVSDVTQEHLITGILWITKMGSPERWNLTAEEIAALLGGFTVDTYQEMLCRAEGGLPITMTPDTVERLSLFLGIWKALQLLVPHERPDLAFAWFNKTNSSPILQNRSIKHYLLENNTLESFYTVRDYLNSNR
ncbi:MAG: hypothetical protein EOO53_11795 [Gammaproteobacteria bacterium]|nr:MAG: hypothetical protein EOO53_11795 [Gammaproteobacteria bacterium]